MADVLIRLSGRLLIGDSPSELNGPKWFLLRLHFQDALDGLLVRSAAGMLPR